MTCWDLIQDYYKDYGLLPPDGDEYAEIAAYARRRGVDVPEQESIESVCQMLRRQQQEAAGQGRLF